VSTVTLNRDKGQSAPTANWTEYEWRRVLWKVGYSGFFLGRVFFCILVSLSFLSPFLWLVSFAGWNLLSELILHVTDNGWDLGDEEEDGGIGEPRALHQVAGEEFWSENGFHHHNTTHWSGTWLG
jgi:hypothetical protein